jgi:hypothetical protein
MTKKNLQSLAHDLTDEEIMAAIPSWPNGKAPGPDGLTASFYKRFLTLLLPDLKARFQHFCNMPQPSENR